MYNNKYYLHNYYVIKLYGILGGFVIELNVLLMQYKAEDKEQGSEYIE